MTGPESPLRAGATRHILFEAGSEFMEDRALRLGVVLAYYGLITLAPLLILLLGIAGVILGNEAANGQLTATHVRWA
jgi:membrane protein